MQTFKAGVRIINVDPRENPGANYGERGTIVDISNGYFYVAYDNGDNGKTNKPEKYYKIINDSTPCVTAECTAKKPMQSITTFIKNLVLTADEKILREVGLKNECGEYSNTAKEIVLNFLTSQNEAKLVEWATAYKAELKAKKD